MEENDNFIEKSESESKLPFGSLFSENKKITRIVFTAAVILMFAVSVGIKAVNDIKNPEPQNPPEVTEEQKAEQEASEESEKQASKTAADYLKEIRIGKSNILAFIILGSALAYVQMRRSNDEKQKRSK